jgi:phosphatidylserine/phosphatidylglycerophosphate/cardiolipin synthase-like enzyme
MTQVLRFVLPALLLLPFTTPLHSSEPITHYQVLFSAQDPLADRLVALIDQEQKSIHAAVYCLTHQKVSHALIKAHRRGVKVEILVDPFSVKARSPLEKLVTQGISLFVWNPPVDVQKPKKKKPLMHDKFCVFGEHTVWTGSFNFTFEGANSNQENAVVLENSEVAQKYVQEFERLKVQGGVRYATYKTSLQ